VLNDRADLLSFKPAAEYLNIVSLHLGVQDGIVAG
jgi:hypothetical protein